MKKLGLVFLWGMLCMTFQQICIASTCQQISEKLTGEWLFDKVHTLKFNGSSLVELDGNDSAISSCIIIPNTNVSFYLNNKLVIIYTQKEPVSSFKMLMGLNTYELKPISTSEMNGSEGKFTDRQQSFVAKYSQGKTQEFKEFSNSLKQTKLLEKLAIPLSGLISLPSQVSLTVDECGQENAFYRPQSQEIVICYELFGKMIDGIKSEYANSATPQAINAAAAGGLSFILMHELGHALIHILELPVLGREEDAADQIGVYLLLQAPRNSAASGLSGALWSFKDNTIFYSQQHFSNEHSLGPQRQSNLACWAFGKDPSRYGYYVESGLISQERAQRCGYEYQKLESTIHKLLGKI